MVDYCERHSPKTIHESMRRECCEKLIDKIIEKKEHDTFFKNHKKIDTKQHIKHVAKYFKKEKSLPWICRKVKKKSRKLKIPKLERKHHQNNHDQHHIIHRKHIKNPQNQHDKHFSKHIKRPFSKLKHKNKGNENKHHNKNYHPHINQLSKKIKKKKPQQKKSQGKKNFKNIFHQEKNHNN
ncbi:hypothetical protein ACQ4LE_009796 [Meloidogyne hapla]|uniref:Uncharacterized protein n=1 Tax=Meloidogyne hapla TaxID=6305 RepID=A0A1I8BVR2_MELHA